MFRGSIVAIVTPMKSDGSIDLDSFRQLLGWHLDNLTDAFVVLGTTGESPTVNLKEREAVLKTALDQVAGQVPVIAGTGVNCTHETIELTKHAMELGVDACLVVTPYYNRPTQEGLYQHFKAVADAVAIPQIMYNVPARTGVDMLPETIGRLSAVSNIVGVKDATGNVARVNEILDQCNDGLDLYSGDDPTGLQFMLAGGKGVISVTANVAPRQMHEMCAAALEHDHEHARNINEKLMLLHKQLMVESNPIPVKWALHSMGKVPPGIRLPLTVLSENKRETLKQALFHAGIMA